MLNPFTAKLTHFAPLSEEEVRRIERLTEHPLRLGARESVTREGDDPDTVNVVLSGWACRFKLLPDGRRQIVGLMLPGDMCDPYVFLLKTMDHTVTTLTPVSLVKVPARAMRELAQASPRLTEAFWWQMLLVAEVQREWTVSLGRRAAIERMAHLFCELASRLELVGLPGVRACDMPLTQLDLADALGLSTVHVNRSLQELRATGLIELRQRRLVIHDWQGLADLAMFDPAYLHGGTGVRPARDLPARDPGGPSAK